MYNAPIMQSGNLHRLVFLIMGAFLLFSPNAWPCGSPSGLPQNYFDGVNEYGDLSYWEKIDDVDFGSGFTLPIHINFKSTRESTSPYLGKSWIVTPLDLNLVQYEENRFTMLLPNGAFINFKRKNSQQSTLDGQSGWLAQIDGDTITAWADCGWKMVFKKGKIASIVNPQNRRADFVYSEGRVSEIREGTSLVLKVDTDPSTGAPTGLVFNKKRVGFEEDKKPYVQSVSGQNVVGQLDQSLSKIVYANGQATTFEYGLDAKQLPTLKVSGTTNRLFTWDPLSKKILKEGDWTYSIKPAEKLGANAELSRKNSKNQSEAWLFDPNKGVYVTVGADGVKRVTTWFVTGELKNKPKKIEEIINGQSKIVFQGSYNEKGQLIREIRDGKTTNYNYNDAGKLESATDGDGKLLWKHVYDPQGNFDKIEYPKSLAGAKSEPQTDLIK